MNSLPDGIAEKLTALLLLGVLLAALWLAAVKPLIDLYDANETRLAEQIQLIEHLRVTAADLPRLRRAVAGRGEPTGGKLLIDAPSDAVAAADLQSVLKDLVTRNGESITSAEALTLEPQGPFHRIAVRLATTGSLALLTGVLKGLDEAHPVLIVDDLAVRTALMSGAAGGPGAPGAAGAGAGEKRLAITMEIHGFRAE
jgi:general secretion pathway protein M